MGTPTLYYREGGTIPAMALLKKELGIDMTMFAFGLPDDRIHAPNERYATRQLPSASVLSRSCFIHQADASPTAWWSAVSQEGV